MELMAVKEITVVNKKGVGVLPKAQEEQLGKDMTHK
jgi:hypothetical protein